MADFKTIFQSYRLEKSLDDDPMQDYMVGELNNIFQSLQKPQKKSWFSRRSTVKGLYVWGGVGRGKTMIMDLFFEALPFDEKRRVHFNIFMLDVHNTIKLMREDNNAVDPLKKIGKDIASKIRVLCFDEFQVYDIADAMVLSELFRTLFDEGVTVIATSNVAPDNLYKDGLQRSRFLPFIPLVKKHMEVVHLDSPTDYRQQALNEDGVYFLQDQAKMQALFDKLIFPNEAMAEVITIKKRDLPIEQSCGNIAWTSFSELCEKPRAAADYKGLADSYDTIFLNNVPRMGYDRRNEAKRFILLIDTLYDAQKRLIINAEKPPQDLYHGQDHAFEFERTISRLLEMQGEEYLLTTSQEKIDTI